MSIISSVLSLLVGGDARIAPTRAFAIVANVDRAAFLVIGSLRKAQRQGFVRAGKMGGWWVGMLVAG